MKKIINTVFSILKFILLFVSFAMTFYIILSMYQRLEKNYLDAIDIFLPYFILLFLLCLNHALHQKQITSNLFYNLTCCLVFGVLIFVAYRAMFDDYLLLQRKTNYNIAFYYFSDIVAPLKSMLYLLIVGNLCFMFSNIKEEEKVLKHDSKMIESKKKRGSAI